MNIYNINHQDKQTVIHNIINTTFTGKVVDIILHDKTCDTYLIHDSHSGFIFCIFEGYDYTLPIGSTKSIIMSSGYNLLKFRLYHNF